MERNLNEIIRCAGCGKEIYYGVSYDSLFMSEVEDNGSELKLVPSRICSGCHDKEVERKTKMLEEEARDKGTNCKNCRFRDDPKDSEPCKFCATNKQTWFQKRNGYDEMRSIIRYMRDTLDNLEHCIKEIETDGQSVCGSDGHPGNDDRSNDLSGNA